MQNRNGFRAVALFGYRNAAVLIVGVGALERLLWNWARTNRGATGEAKRVAIAIGSGHGFADAYRVGQGATAHLLPVSPGIAGLVYRLLGPGSMLAETLLAAWSIALAMMTYLLLFRAFGRLGTPRWARLAGLAYACIAPAYIGQEAVDFRVWEGGLAACLAALFLELLAADLTGRQLGSRRVVAAAATCAVLFFVNPLLGGAAIVCAALYGLRELSPRQTALGAAAAAGVLALLIVPWALRNQRVMHHPILLRSNAGLELALANYPTAVHSTDRKRQFLNRLYDIHPSFNEEAYRAVKSEGEVAYSQQLGARAKRWMEEHPAAAAHLMMLHVEQTLVPQVWEFSIFALRMPPALRAIAVDLASICGLLGLALGVVSGRRGWGYLATMIGAWVLVSSPFQPVTRYTYLAYPFLVFCGADLAARAGLALRRARGAHRGTGAVTASGPRW